MNKNKQLIKTKEDAGFEKKASCNLWSDRGGDGGLSRSEVKMMRTEKEKKKVGIMIIPPVCTHQKKKKKKKQARK